MKRILLSLLVIASFLFSLACQPGGTGGGDQGQDRRVYVANRRYRQLRHLFG